MVTHPMKLKYWPVLLSGLLVVWTLYISPITKYGDTWAIIPVFAIFLTIFIIHVLLLIKGRWNSGLWLYALVDIPVVFMLSVWSLTLISKDSL